jgi:mRNA interferase MazF
VVIQRGQLWWADLPEPRGSEPCYRRPVIVVQSDALNWCRVPTVIVVGVTTNLRLLDAPGSVLLRARESGLPHDSVANVSQVVTVDQRFLLERIGAVDGAIMASVARGLRLALDL